MTDTAAPSKAQQAIGKLPPEIRAAVELRRAQNVVAAQIAATNWGKGMDLETRRSVAEWGRRHEIDVTKEIDILGGRPYLNHQFYFNRFAVMVERGLVEYAVTDHVEVDDRLKEFGEEGEKEITRRGRLRSRYGLPQNAVSSVVARVKLRTSDLEYTAAKWCGGRKNDPVGEAFPVETSETRALRRVMRLLISYIPNLSKQIRESNEDAQISLDSVLRASAETQRVDAGKRARQLTPGNVADAMESYGTSSEDVIPVPIGRKPRKGEAIEVPAPSREAGEEEYIDDSDLADD